ncbi:polyubiquitin [Aristolochia californica]|uniref:polyubiquitin n=1 Tax=Aristolochia californica TaxID=171875 RepID=UPI0035D5E3D6
MALASSVSFFSLLAGVAAAKRRLQSQRNFRHLESQLVYGLTSCLVAVLQARAMVIVIISIEEVKHAMGVKFTETVLQLKQRLELLFGIPVYRQTLSIYDFELIDEFDIDFYQVSEGTQIDVSITARKMRIWVTIGTRRVPLLLDGTETVADVKEEIQKQDGTPMKRLILFFSGTEMEDHSYLREYGAIDDSEINVILRPVTPPPQPQTRRLNLVVKTTSLLNSANIPVEMDETCTVREVRRLLLGKKLLPPDDYFFIHKQRILSENKSLYSHGIKNGDHLHVFKGTVSSTG